MIRDENKKHAEAVVKKIMSEIPVKILRHVRKFKIQLMGETVNDKGHTKMIGWLEIHGTTDVHTKIKIMEIVKKESGERKIKNLITL